MKRKAINTNTKDLIIFSNEQGKTNVGQLSNDSNDEQGVFTVYSRFVIVVIFFS